MKFENSLNLYDMLCDINKTGQNPEPAHSVEHIRKPGLGQPIITRNYKGHPGYILSHVQPFYEWAVSDLDP